MWQNNNKVSHGHLGVEDASSVTHSFSISIAWGCFIFLALSISRNRSFRSPSARPRRSAFSFWCFNVLLFFSLSASWAMKKSMSMYSVCVFIITNCTELSNVFLQWATALLHAVHLSQRCLHYFACEQSARPSCRSVTFGFEIKKVKNAVGWWIK